MGIPELLLGGELDELVVEADPLLDWELEGPVVELVIEPLMD